MQNVHEDEPVRFETRWAMSYLRGPLTLSQLRTASTHRRGRTFRRRERIIARPPVDPASSRSSYRLPTRGRDRYARISGAIATIE